MHGRGAAGRERGVTEYASLRPSARSEAERRDRDGNGPVRELHVFTTPQDLMVLGASKKSRSIGHKENNDHADAEYGRGNQQQRETDLFIFQVHEIGNDE